jgi:hypothetical protein
MKHRVDDAPTFGHARADARARASLSEQHYGAHKGPVKVKSVVARARRPARDAGPSDL